MQNLIFEVPSLEHHEVLGPRAMARCAVGLLGDDGDERQISDTSFERKVTGGRGRHPAGHGGGYRGVG